MKRDFKDYQKKAANGITKLHGVRRFCLASLAVGVLMTASVLGGCASAVRQQSGGGEVYPKAQEALQTEEGGERIRAKNSHPGTGEAGSVAANGLAGDGEIFINDESQVPSSETAPEAENPETTNLKPEDTESTKNTANTVNTANVENVADAEDAANAENVANTENKDTALTGAAVEPEIQAAQAETAAQAEAKQTEAPKSAAQTEPEIPSAENSQSSASGSLQIFEGTPEKEPLSVNVTMKAPDDAHSGPGYQQEKEELKGVWISYLEWNTLPKEQQAFQTAVNQMFDNCVNLGMNAVFVHVRPDADAMYPSSYFPWSKFASGKQGVNPGYDPLAYMIDAAHNRGLKFHAWFNPYRVTGYLNSWDDLADSNPAKVWLTDSDTANDRWVLLHDGYYYFNPSIPQVRELIINGVKEVVANYNVDGVHFDDYFYPTLNNADPARSFDKPEYDVSGSSLDITNWRRDNVNQLVRGVYAAVKELKPAVEFGVSPAGYVANLRSDAKLFVDIDTWMSQPGYVDYIMPQLYWGFEAKVSGGSPAPYAFENNLNTWIELKNRGNVTLYLGLAMSRAGTNVADNNEVSEWQRNNDIIKRQTEAARNSGQVSGVCYFSYSSFFGAAAQQEVANLLPALKN